MFIRKSKIEEIAEKIIMMEEQKREKQIVTIKEIVKESPQKIKPILTTKKHVPLPAKIFEHRGSGTIKEMTIISKGKDYIVDITISDKKIISSTLDDLMKMSYYINWISAQYDDEEGNYVLSITDLPFNDRIIIMLRPRGTNIVDKVIIKAEVI